MTDSSDIPGQNFDNNIRGVSHSPREKASLDQALHWLAALKFNRTCGLLGNSLNPFERGMRHFIVSSRKRILLTHN